MRLAIPGLVDLLRVEEAGMIAGVVADPRMDRRYEPRGPLLNRLILGRIRAVLQLDGVSFPPVAPREDASRRAAQAREERRFAALGHTAREEDVAALAGYVRGEGDADAAGPLAQGMVGRLFVADYRADKASWAAAEVLGKAPSTFNPLRLLGWALTHRVDKARALLAERVGGDLVGMHATGVAIHNMVEALRRMRALYADRVERDLVSTEAAVARSLVAPRQVLRQPTAPGSLPVGAFGRDTLVLLALEKANARDPGYDTAFMSGQWCQCPARDWVPSLYARVWRAAVEGA